MPGKTLLHPLDPLSEAEIVSASQILRQYIAEKTDVKAFKFLHITLAEPPKADVLKFLGIAQSVAELGKVQPEAVTIPRKAEASFVDLGTGRAYNADVVLLLSVEGGSSGGHVERMEKLDEGVQPAITLEELNAAEDIIRKDARVLALAKDVGVEPHQLFADGWSIGYDHRFGKRRLQQCLLYARFNPDSNLYSHPMDFFPVVDSNTNEVVHIDFAAHRSSSGKLSVHSTEPPHTADDAVQASGRQRIPPPTEVHDYLPEFLNGKDGFTLRDDVKPLHVQQPEGVSFHMSGNVLQWQKWKLHIGFNYREGVVLNTVSYNDNGTERPLFYRISMAEMVVPYGAPEHPHPRKFAFDVGEYGMGMLANSLELGCDCLGTIKYLDGICSAHDGQPVKIKNAICIHEEDAGILWKHTDFRPGGKAHAVRSRKLLIQFTATVANYEYILAYSLKQDGTLELEVKLTGILNLYVMDQGEDHSGVGTQVAPRVMAHNHQHLFSLRVDPMIDGLANSLYETNVHRMPQPTGSPENFAGNGFYYEKTLLDNTEVSLRQHDAAQGRTWLIANQDKKHYATGSPEGYKIMCKDMPPLLPQADSWVARRAPFSKYSIAAVPYEEGRLYPAGKYVPQTLEAPKDSLLGWGEGQQDLVQKDMILFMTFGVTHIPRPEDYPIMPVETCSIMFKPNGFFKQNPALDVPSNQDKKSVLANGSHTVNGTSSCCS